MFQRIRLVKICDEIPVFRTSVLNLAMSAGEFHRDQSTMGAKNGKRSSAAANPVPCVLPHTINTCCSTKYSYVPHSLDFFSDRDRLGITARFCNSSTIFFFDVSSLF
jgi:hypothetical protein